MTRGEIHRRLADLTSLRLARRLDQFMELFAPDVVVYRNCSHRGVFDRRVLWGKEAFRQSLRLVDEEHLAVDGEIVDVLIENQRAWVRWRTRWREIGSGRECDLDMAYFIRWRDGLVAEMHEFLDRPVPATTGVALRESLDELVRPKPSGLERDEMLRIIEALASFPTTEGPDIAKFLRYCSPSIVCEFVGDRARIPYAGRHVGIDALTRIMRDIATEFQQLGQQLSDVVIDGGRVGLRRSVEWRHRGTGRRGVVELAELMRFENGVIVEAIEYRDSIMILEMQS